MLINNIYLINPQTVWEKKPAEFWKILKSLDRKKLDQNSELKELMTQKKLLYMCKIKDDVKIIMKLSKIKLMKNFKVLTKTCFNPETDMMTL